MDNEIPWVKSKWTTAQLDGKAVLFSRGGHTVVNGVFQVIEKPNGQRRINILYDELKTAFDGVRTVYHLSQAAVDSISQESDGTFDIGSPLRPDSRPN